jgi:iron complex outermembrane receptor protein
MSGGIRKAGLTAALTVTVAMSSAHAQTSTGGASQETAGTELGELSEIVVTAQRKEESLSRTPVSMAVLGGEALAQRAIVTESDLQSVVPGLGVKASSGSNQLNYVIRGQSLDSFSGVRPGVLPYVNEVQVAGSGSSGFYDLQSVQVLKGPQGTLFGRNATGGAVLFTTTKPSEDFGGYVSASGGNYNLFRTEGALNVPIIPQVLLSRIAGFYETHEGYQYNLYDGSHPGDVRRYGIRGSLTFNPTDKISNELVVDFAHSGGSSVSEIIHSIYAPGSTNAPIPANILFTPALDAVGGPGAWQTYLAAHPKVDPAGIVSFTATQLARGPYVIDIDSPTNHRSNNLVVSNITTIELASDLQFKNIYGYTSLRSFDGAEFDGTPYDLDQRNQGGDDSRYRQISEEAQLSGKILEQKLNYVTGFYFSDEFHPERAVSDLIDLSPIIPVTSQVNNVEARNRTYAGYAQGTYDLSVLAEGLSATAGARYTSERVSSRHVADDVYLANPHAEYVTPLEDTFNKVSWHVGFQEQITPELMLYLTGQRSFRSGGFNFFSAPIPGLGNDGGSEYGPETATDVELGAKFQGRIMSLPARLNVAFYNQWVEDAQRVTYAQVFGAPSAVTVNVPRTLIRGVESDGTLSLLSWLTLGGSVSYTDAAFTQNQVSVLGAPPVSFGPVPDVARWSGVSYAEAAAPLTADLRGTLRMEFYGQTASTFSSTENTLNPGTGIPGYGLLSFRLGVDQLKEGWSVSANLKNALNHVYYVGGVGFGSLFTFNTIVPGDPRTWQIEARYHF